MNRQHQCLSSKPSVFRRNLNRFHRDGRRDEGDGADTHALLQRRSWKSYRESGVPFSLPSSSCLMPASSSSSSWSSLVSSFSSVSCSSRILPSPDFSAPSPSLSHVEAEEKGKNRKKKGRRNKVSLDTEARIPLLLLSDTMRVKSMTYSSSSLSTVSTHAHASSSSSLSRRPLLRSRRQPQQQPCTAAWKDEHGDDTPQLREKRGGGKEEKDHGSEDDQDDGNIVAAAAKEEKMAASKRVSTSPQKRVHLTTSRMDYAAQERERAWHILNGRGRHREDENRVSGGGVSSSSNSNNNDTNACNNEIVVVASTKPRLVRAADASRARMMTTTTRSWPNITGETNVMTSNTEAMEKKVADDRFYTNEYCKAKTGQTDCQKTPTWKDLRLISTLNCHSNASVSCNFEDCLTTVDKEEEKEKDGEEVIKVPFYPHCRTADGKADREGGDTKDVPAQEQQLQQQPQGGEEDETEERELRKNVAQIPPKLHRFAVPSLPSLSPSCERRTRQHCTHHHHHHYYHDFDRLAKSHISRDDYLYCRAGAVAAASNGNDVDSIQGASFAPFAPFASTRIPTGRPATAAVAAADATAAAAVAAAGCASSVAVGEDDGVEKRASKPIASLATTLTSTDSTKKGVTAVALPSEKREEEKEDTKGKQGDHNFLYDDDGKDNGKENEEVHEHENYDDHDGNQVSSEVMMTISSSWSSLATKRKAGSTILAFIKDAANNDDDGGDDKRASLCHPSTGIPLPPPISNPHCTSSSSSSSLSVVKRLERLQSELMALSALSRRKKEECGWNAFAVGA